MEINEQSRIVREMMEKKKNQYIEYLKKGDDKGIELGRSFYSYCLNLTDTQRELRLQTDIIFYSQNK